MREYVAAIDQGTTGTRCILFGLDGVPAGSAYREHRQIFPRPGWVEHDPAEILGRVHEVCAEALRAAAPARVLGIGITNQRETVVAWDAETGRPAANAIVWQDARTADACAEAIAMGWDGEVRARTGLPISTYFSATKMRWLLERSEEVAALAASGRLRLGTIDSWLIWNLTGGPRGGAHVTDPTNASRTLLCRLSDLAWDETLLDLFGVPAEALAEIRPSIARDPYGATVGDGPFGVGVPVAGDLGDQQAALAGQGCFAPGEAKNTYGTGSFLLELVGDSPMPSACGLLSTAACSGGEERAYALEGPVAITGAAVQWLRDGLGLIDDVAESEALASSLEDNGGVYFVPALTGLGSPHWRPDVRGTIAGLTRGTTRSHVVRAALEAAAYQVADVLAAMPPIEQLRVDGGMTRNRWLMQFQADVLGAPVIVPEVAETTALGAAYLAGIGAGRWTIEDVATRWREAARFEPRMGDDERETLLAGWRKALGRARDWADE
jgi:glycerol kinase